MSIVGILEAAVGFGLLIFVHELGHFLAAKWMGVRVDVFSLGFGKALLKTKRGQTVYQLSAIPFGGYVKMVGEEEDPSKPAPPDSFSSKSVGQRSIIFAAGVIMNVIFGFLVFMLAYRVGVPVVPARAGELQPGSPAWMAGIERGDEIIAINHISPPIDFEDLKVAVTLSSRDEALHLTIRRNGQTLQKEFVPEYQRELGLKTAGIGMPFTMALADPKKLPPPEEGLDYAAPYSRGAAAGDVIVAASTEGGKPVRIETPSDLDSVVDVAGGRPVELTLQRPGATETHTATVDLVAVGKPGWLGIQFGSTRIKAVRPDSWADKAGLKVDDRITSILGRRVRSPSEIETALKGVVREDASSKVDRMLEGRFENAEPVVTVLRGNQSVSLDLPASRPGRLNDALAFQPDLTVDKAWINYPAQKAGMESGDVVVALNGTPVADHPAFSEMLSKTEGKPQELTWRRDGKEMTATVLQQRRWVLPVALASVQQPVKVGFLRSVTLGGRKAFQWVVRIYGTLSSLAERQISVRHLNGPLSIGYFTYAAAKEGAGTLLYLLGVLSVNLGVFNLLPIPVLDGGHLLFALIEKARGKPVSEKIRAAATYVGLSLILGIAVVAMWNDIQSLILSRF